MCEALHYAEPDWVTACPHYDRDCAGGFLDRQIGRQWPRDDNAWVESDQFGRQLRKSLNDAICKTVLETNGTPFDVTELSHGIAKCVEMIRRSSSRARLQKA